MQRVVPRAQRSVSARSSGFAEHGFAVLVTDGRGNALAPPGPEWSKAVFGDVLSVPLETIRWTRLDAISVQLPDLDRGGSGSAAGPTAGRSAAIAVIRRPRRVPRGPFPGPRRTDQRLYDTHWRERFLGLPQQNPEGYDRSSTMTLGREA